MSTVLDLICEDKLEHVQARKAELPRADVEAAARDAAPARGFAKRLAAAVTAGGYGLIAEIKHASPSRGVIREPFEPAALARAYAAGGASCISVLTDVVHFQGDDADLIEAWAAVDLPVLRKDFMLDPYQIVESRALGADCVLLILAVLDDARAAELASVAADYGMDVLAEVHDAAELQRALKLDTPLIGINNRNLKTLDVDLAVAETLAAEIPADRLAIGESGLAEPADLTRLSAVGINCFLVGESLMREKDVEAATRALLAPAA